MSEHNNLKAIQETKTLEQPWDDLDLDVGREHQLCSLHGGKTLNIHRLESGVIVYRCMNPSCEAHTGGTIVDFVRLAKNMASTKEAIVFLLQTYGTLLKHPFDLSHVSGKSEELRKVEASITKLDGPILPGEQVKPPTYYFDQKGRRHEEVLVKVERDGVELWESLRLDACSMAHVTSGRWGHKEASVAVLRWDMGQGAARNKVIRPFLRNSQGAWSLGVDGLVTRPLYRLDQIDAYPERAVLIVEGEKCMQRLETWLAGKSEQEACVVTTCVGGAEAAEKTDFSLLKKTSAPIYIIPDCDKPGLVYARVIAAALPDADVRLIWVHPDKDEGTGYDVADWIEQHPDGDLFDASMTFPLSYNAELESLIRRARNTSISQAEGLIFELVTLWRLDGLALDLLFGCIATACDISKTSVKARYKQLSMAQVAPYGYEHLIASKVLSDEFGGHLVCSQGLWWAWQGRHWDKLYSQDDVNAHIEPVITREWRPDMEKVKLVKGARELLPMLCHKNGSVLRLNEPPQPVLNCTNVELVLQEDGSVVTRTHQPENYSMLALDVTYDPEATCPTYDAALELWFNHDQELIDFWHEVAGYLIQPDRWLKHFFLMQGEGDNGKSTLMKIIATLCGNAVAHIEIEKLDERFALAPLVGKLIALDDDVKAGAKLPDGILKKLSETKVASIEYKTRTPVDIVLVAAPVMLCNRWPSISDITPATLDRAMCIPFPHSIPLHKRDPNLLKIIRTKELSGVLNRCLEGLARLRARGRFEQPMAVELCKQSFLGHSNHTIQWAQHRLDKVPSTQGTYSVSARELYDDYRAWCTEQGFQHIMVSMTSLYKTLKGLSLHVQSASASDGRFRVWGVRIKDELKQVQLAHTLCTILKASGSIRDVVSAIDLVNKICELQNEELEALNRQQLRDLVEQAGFIVVDAHPRKGRFCIHGATL